MAIRIARHCARGSARANFKIEIFDLLTSIYEVIQRVEIMPLLNF